jgi:hypothetical protein
MEAVSIWLLAPTAIEADFRFRGLRIADWLTGKMSSREFLVLLRHLEDTSAFKTLAPEPYGRDGNWTEAVQIAAKAHEEFAMYRASEYVGGPNEYMPQVFISPLERAAYAAEAAEERLASLDLESLLSGAIDL